jgi:hypothetical protein
LILALVLSFDERDDAFLTPPTAHLPADAADLPLQIIAAPRFAVGHSLSQNEVLTGKMTLRKPDSAPSEN